jgi:hypothetical protein
MYFSLLIPQFYCFYTENHLQKCIQGAIGLHSIQSLRIFRHEINILPKTQPITQQGIFVTNIKEQHKVCCIKNTEIDTVLQ